MIKVNIIDRDKDLKDFKTVDEYLEYTYGEKKLKESKKDSEFTYLDVVGYTLDKQGYETEDGDGKYYDLDEIEKCMYEKWDRKRK